MHAVAAFLVFWLLYKLGQRIWRHYQSRTISQEEYDRLKGSPREVSERRDPGSGFD